MAITFTECFEVRTLLASMLCLTEFEFQVERFKSIGIAAYKIVGLHSCACQPHSCISNVDIFMWSSWTPSQRHTSCQTCFGCSWRLFYILLSEHSPQHWKNIRFTLGSMNLSHTQKHVAGQLEVALIHANLLGQEESATLIVAYPHEHEPHTPSFVSFLRGSRTPPLASKK